MEIVKGKGKKTLLSKTWKWCQALGAGIKRRPPISINPLPKSTTKSLQYCSMKPSDQQDKRKVKRRVAPVGCFTVYVGTQKQRFFIKIEFASHPLFKKLLEDAKLEYGYSIEGPILLPCDVNLFYEVLEEMQSSNEIQPVCIFAKGRGSSTSSSWL